MSSTGTKPLYVRMAGAQTLRKRWREDHLRDRAGGSALRRSLGIHLRLVEEKLRLPDRYYRPDVETAITNFLHGCFNELHPTATAEEARRLEADLIRRVGPILNVAHPIVPCSSASRSASSAEYSL